MFKKAFFVIFSAVSLLFLCAKYSKAAMTCQLQLSSTEIVAGYPITLGGTGCDTEATNHTALIFDAAGDGSTTVVPPIPIIVANNGTFLQLVGVISEPGNYVIIVHAGDPTDTARINFTITEAPTPVTYECGDYVAPGGTCPAGCPYKPESATGVVPHVPALCDCGGSGQSPCPSGNQAGLPQCKPDYAYNASNNSCEYVDPSGVQNFACGETVPLELISSLQYSCDPKCPLRGEVCACGGSGQGCCPGNRCTSPIDTCMNPGICRIATEGVDPSPYLCDDLNSVDTAIGCIEFDSINNIVGTVTGFLLGVGGGIALILIAFASFRIMTSSGDPKAIQGSKELLMSAIGGLLMVALSVTILRVIGVDILGLFG